MSCSRSFRPRVLEFLKIQGLGPKSIALIFEHYRIGTIDELERLCQEQKLRELPRMGAKLEEKVLRSIAQYRQRTGRYLLSYAEGIAAEARGLLRAVPGVDAVTPAGSLRRGRETVGDLDLLVTGPDATAALEPFAHGPRVDEVLARGENKASAQGRAARACRWMCARSRRRASARPCSTSPAARITTWRSARAPCSMGLKLSEYGLFRVEDDVRVAGETEEGIYQALGLSWIPPELRENTGEIEAAEEGRLPELVELARHSRRSAHAHHGDRRPRDVWKKWRRRRERTATSTSRSRITRRRSP